MQNTAITPVIGVVAAGLACTTVAGSVTVTSSAAFGSVAAGQRVYGAGIPYGTKVLSKESSSSITLDTPALLGGTPTLQFSYFAATAYTAGDAIGWPFEIPLSELKGIMLVDKSDQMASVILYVFNGNPNGTPILDNAAFAPSDADAAKIIARYSLTGTADVGGAKLVFPADAELPLAKCGSSQMMYGQLVAVGTPTFATVADLVLNLTGE